jgi:hypothetical protein
MASRSWLALASLVLVTLTAASSFAVNDVARKGNKSALQPQSSEPIRTLSPTTTGDKPVGPPYAQPQAPAAAAFSIDWYSINGGGVIGAASTNWTLDATVGQSVAGFGSSPSYQLEIGFWYGADACPIALTGDADNSTEIKLSDVIYLVNYVLKAGATPIPCAAAGDVTCDGEVKLSDVIYLVNYVLKAGTPPCDVCTLIPGTWNCP